MLQISIEQFLVASHSRKQSPAADWENTSATHSVQSISSSACTDRLIVIV